MICFILVLAQQRQQQQQQWQQQKQQQKQQQQLQQQQLAGTSLTNEREQRGENLRTKIITRSFCPTELLRIITLHQCVRAAKYELSEFSLFGPIIPRASQGLLGKKSLL